MKRMKIFLLALTAALVFSVTPALAAPPKESPSAVSEPCPCGHWVCADQKRTHPTCEPQYYPHNWFNKWCFAKACNDKNNDAAGHWPRGEPHSDHHIPVPQNVEPCPYGY